MDNIKNLESRLFKLERTIQNQIKKEQVLTGATSGTANTQYLLRHTLNKRPEGYIICYGDVYVFDSDDRTIDVRSTQTSQNFKITIF